MTSMICYTSHTEFTFLGTLSSVPLSAGPGCLTLDDEQSGEDCSEHVSKSVLVSGFREGTPADIRVDAVDGAVDSGALLVDKSHWGIIKVRGQDRLRFLHSQGTNAFEGSTTGKISVLRPMYEKSYVHGKRLPLLEGACARPFYFPRRHDVICTWDVWL